ncbi:hypothetical protein ACQKOF_06970 [Lysinibacillus sp. NPDC093190]|uniref:hypothetical protein n=1 Tax=Lysinibacillus sp. NPDC093190 TaxID=3390575 RepID=UPI003CFED6A6
MVKKGSKKGKLPEKDIFTKSSTLPHGIKVRLTQMDRLDVYRKSTLNKRSEKAFKGELFPECFFNYWLFSQRLLLL